MSKRTALLGVVGAVAACVAAVGAFAAAEPNLAPIALTPVDVGPGYKVVGHSACLRGNSCATMNFCGPYATELARTGRLQLFYTAAKGSPRVSNEVVSYKTGSAQKALTEARTKEPRCAGVHQSPDGDVTVRVSRLSHPGLLPGSLVLQLSITAPVKGKRVTEKILTVYQARHDVLCAIYAYLDPGVSAADTNRVGYHAAAKCTAHLKQFA